MPVINKVGIEAEFLLYNAKDELIIPPSGWDRDGFPLLGEIRGEEGKNVGETVTNFIKRKMEIIELIKPGHTMRFMASEKCPLALYKKANKEINYDRKAADMGKVLNMYGINIEDFSDQVIDKGKIQGVRVSCGLHIHFSSEELKTEKYEEAIYDPIQLPIGVGLLSGAELTAKDAVLSKTLIVPIISLYKHNGYKEKRELICRASRLNKPAIHHIVLELDKAFFDRFSPIQKDRTKFRQAGFFELKPYGFEYRSLPMTGETEVALPEITAFAFKLLKDINEY
jgi:hypothetical protein